MSLGWNCPIKHLRRVVGDSPFQEAFAWKFFKKLSSIRFEYSNEFLCFDIRCPKKLLLCNAQMKSETSALKSNFTDWKLMS